MRLGWLYTEGQNYYDDDSYGAMCWFRHWEAVKYGCGSTLREAMQIELKIGKKYV